MPESTLRRPLLRWYAQHARDLPWRRPGTPPWAVLVSEVMLQQTPVARVLAPYDVWLTRWPTPSAQAADSAAEAVRAWDRLGYPRRAQRLHAAATAMVAQHGGQVPSTYEDLRALPGIGDYTAAAVASFAFDARQVVLDTNVRRVLARAVGARAQPSPSVTAAERALATALLPDDDSSPRWAAATMELGALVCTARSPRCPDCPIRDRCAWYAAGRPPYAGPARRAQSYDGTDRQARGRILALLRETAHALPAEVVAGAWPDAVQRRRALESLVEDGLIEPLRGGRDYVLGGTARAAN